MNTANARCLPLPLPLPLALVLLLSASALADVRLPAVFGDHMVLQRETTVAVWGFAEPGERVAVRGSWSAAASAAVTGEDGRWSTTIATPRAGGPFTLTVSGDDELTLSDVLVGEVWICSGQSNMQWNVASCADAEQEIADADHPGIRLFTVAKVTSLAPAEDVRGAWATCTPEKIPTFSAVAYYFGRELMRELDVPIGLISTNWGGTVCEAWTSRETLAGFPEFGQALARIDDARASGGSAPTVAELQERWWAALEAGDPGMTGGWMRGTADGEHWQETSVPATFSDVGLGSFDGCVWFRRSVEVPDDWVGRDLVLDIGPVDDMDITFLNGELVGATRGDGKWQAPRSYAVPAGVAKAGANVIAVCAVDAGGNGSIGVAGDVRPPMRLRPADDPAGTGLALEGTWRARAGASTSTLGGFPRRNWFHQNSPTALHNGMLAPLVPFGMCGAIWYQGESNRTRAAQYRRLFPAMISDWRSKWGIGDFPFYYVQIAPFGYGGDSGQAAELREAQTMALSLPNTGMAVTMDVGNPKDIHPKNKQDVGRRLALWALAQDYGKDVAYSGPLYRAMVVVGGEARLHFDHAQGGLVAEGAPTHFTMAGEDRVFHPAQARIEGETVIVGCEAVPRPIAVRYAWGAADEPNLKNGAGLPAPSFRSDDWPAVSADR